MRLLTYNIWFDPYYQEERTMAVIKIILTKRPDFVSLQEVTPKSINILHKYLDGGYYFSKNNLDRNYDNIILSRYKIVDNFSQKFPYTNMDRQFHYITSKVDNKLIKIIGVHLESDYKSRIKYGQLQYIFDQIKYDKNVFIMGDCNIYDNINVSLKLKDGWEDDGRKMEMRYTYDSKQNSNINGNYKSRIDRVFMDREWKVTEFELLGKEFIVDKVQPSDHFGIFLKVFKE